MVFCPKWVQLPLFTSLSLFFIGLTITGLVFPTAIDQLQTGTIKTGVQYNAATMTTSGLNTFHNTTTNIVYYLFNLTNYKSVLMNGSLPVYAEVGPIRMTKYRYRVDVDWSDPNQVGYKYIVLYELPVGDPVWESIKTAPIINPNLLYWGALAQVGQTLSSSPSPASTGTPGPSLAESNLCAALSDGFGTTLFPSLNSYFNNATGALLTAFRFATVPVYFKLVFASLATVPGTPPAVHWGFGPIEPAYSTRSDLFGGSAIKFTGFELLTALDGATSDVAGYTAVGAKVTNLFSSSNPYSLVFSGVTPTGLPASGINLWLAFAKAGQSVPFDTVTFTNLVTLLTTGNGITVNDARNIALWIGVLTRADNQIYFQFIGTFLNKFLSWTPYSADQPNHAAAKAGFSLTSWEDVGRVQFGTGIITTIMGAASLQNDTAKGYTADANGEITSVGLTLQFGVPTSVFDLFPSFAPDSTNPLPYEWYTSIYRYSDQFPTAKYYYNNGTSGEFNLQSTLQSNSAGYASYMDKYEVDIFLTNMALGGPPIVTSLLSALSAAKSFVGFKVFSDAYAQNLNALIPLFPYTFTPPSPLPDLPGRNRFLDLNHWFSGFICNSTAQSTFYGAKWPKGPGAANELGDDGISKVGGNNGLFRRKAVYETLFGYHDTVIKKDVPGLVGLLNVDVRNYKDSGLPGYENAFSEQQLIDNYRASMQNNQNTIITTGRDDLNRMGQYVKYSGITSLTDYCSLIDPSSTSTCSPNTLPGLATTTKKNAKYRIWGQDESIKGSTDGSAYPPLQGDPAPSLSLYVEQVKRNAFLVYKSDVQFKGIFLRRYELDLRMLLWDQHVDPVNGTVSLVDNIYRNSNYRMHPGFMPNGLVHVSSAYGGVPLVVSQPHFLRGDPLETAKLGGLHPDVAIHETFVEIEPRTGRTMHLTKRLQASLWGDWYTPKTFQFKDNVNGDVINPSFDFTFTNYFKKVFPRQQGNPSIPATQTYFPYYWADENAEIKDSDASDFKKSVYDLENIGKKLRIIFSVVGGVLAILFTVLAVRACKTTSAKNATAY